MMQRICRKELVRPAYSVHPNSLELMVITTEPKALIRKTDEKIRAMRSLSAIVKMLVIPGYLESSRQMRNGPHRSHE